LVVVAGWVLTLAPAMGVSVLASVTVPLIVPVVVTSGGSVKSSGLAGLLHEVKTIVPKNVTNIASVKNINVLDF
jgi:hypothetical protein